MTNIMYYQFIQHDVFSGVVTILNAWAIRGFSYHDWNGVNNLIAWDRIEA
jgi:hypothetical protein